MAFTVEDGSGLVNANSYASVAEADDYWADRGEPSAWASASNTEKEQALVKATAYLDSRRRFPYAGTKKAATQRLQWPRAGAYERGAAAALADDAVPAQVKDAAAALAAKVLAGEDIQPTLERGGAVKSEKVGPIETQYFEGAPTEVQVIEALDAVSGLVRSGRLYAPTPYLAQAATADEFKSGTYENPERSE